MSQLLWVSFLFIDIFSPRRAFQKSVEQIFIVVICSHSCQRGVCVCQMRASESKLINGHGPTYAIDRVVNRITAAAPSTPTKYFYKKKNIPGSLPACSLGIIYYYVFEESRARRECSVTYEIH